jgi:hypothetical protein
MCSWLDERLIGPVLSTSQVIDEHEWKGRHYTKAEDAEQVHDDEVFHA